MFSYLPPSFQTTPVSPASIRAPGESSFATYKSDGDTNAIGKLDNDEEEAGEAGAGGPGLRTPPSQTFVPFNLSEDPDEEFTVV